MSQPYDLIVVGGGSAGLTAVGLAVQFGVRVALVEKDRIGGDCTWSGCVPSKTLLKAARVAHEMRSASTYGLPSVEPEVDLKSVMAHVRSVIEDIYEEESPGALRADGIAVYLGNARFLDSHTISVGDATLEGRHFLLCTGALPSLPAIEGLDDVDYLTYETVWDLQTLPERLIVVGGGPVGCELAQALCRLGAKVTLVTDQDRLLPRDEAQASHVLAQVLAAEGISLRFTAPAQRAWQDEGAIHLVAGGEELVGEALLVATGRRPHVEGLDLEHAGVNYSDQGIEVDENLQTSQNHIYAAGDCLGSHQFTHYAAWQAAMAVRNALLPGSSKGVTDLVPWTTFTDPEVAHVGKTEEQGRQRYGDDVATCHWPMGQVDRARAEGDTTGFLKLVHKRDGTLLGATVVARRAGEMIHEWILALHQGVKVGELSQVIHVYPTYSTAFMQAAAHIRVQQLLGGASGKIIRSLARLMR